MYRRIENLTFDDLIETRIIEELNGVPGWAAHYTADTSTLSVENSPIDFKVNLEKVVEDKTGYARANQLYVKLVNPAEDSDDSDSRALWFDYFSNAITAHLFINSNGETAPYLYLVVDSGNQLYTHLWMGLPARIADFSAGGYIGGSYYNPNYWDRDRETYTHWRANRFGEQGQYVFLNEDKNFTSYTGVNSVRTSASNDIDNAYQLIDSSPSSFNKNNILVPINIFHHYQKNYNHLWGTFPNVRMISIAELNPEDEITVDTEKWKVFPYARKQEEVVDPEYPWSGYYGLAYRVGAA